MIISLMMVPAILTLITRYQQIVSMGLTNSFSGVILPGIAGYIPSSFILLFTFFAGLPKDLFEAAEVDGANDAKTYVKIVAPLSSPILWTIGIQTFVGQWNDYLWSKLVMTDDTWKTLPVYLTDLTEDLAATTGYAVPFAGYVLSSIPLIVIFIAASKQFISGMTSGAFKM
jgi:ABC-type glycerol-3-phosphate transport system permease component